jgi:hypothetical protein
VNQAVSSRCGVEAQDVGSVSLRAVTDQIWARLARRWLCVVDVALPEDVVILQLRYRVRPCSLFTLGWPATPKLSGNGLISSNLTSRPEYFRTAGNMTSIQTESDCSNMNNGLQDHTDGLRQAKEYLNNSRLLNDASGRRRSHARWISCSVSLGPCTGAPTSV